MRTKPIARSSSSASRNTIASGRPPVRCRTGRAPQSSARPSEQQHDHLRACPRAGRGATRIVMQREQRCRRACSRRRRRRVAGRHGDGGRLAGRRDYRARQARASRRIVDRSHRLDLSMTSRTGGEILVANLLAQGATHAFGVPGESYLAGARRAARRRAIACASSSAARKAAPRTWPRRTASSPDGPASRW